MRVQRSKQTGVRREVLMKVRALEQRCAALERDVSLLGCADRLRELARRLSSLEEQEHAKAS